MAVKDGELDAPLHEMSDDVAVIQFAVELGRGPYHTLPAAMHLRVIRVLLDDLADGQAMRTELQVRGGGSCRLGRRGPTMCLIAPLCAPLRCAAALPVYVLLCA